MRNFKLVKRFFYLFIILGQLVLVTGCFNAIFPSDSTNPSNDKSEPVVSNKMLQKTFFTYFDTVSTVRGYESDGIDAFNENCENIAKILEEYHKLFDIYNAYDGVINLYTINQNAGQAALKVDKKLIDFLVFTKEIYTITNGKTNVMMGAVLKLWHDERTAGINNPSIAKLPNMDALTEAKKHTNIDLLEIDIENNTVRITDKDASIDVGAIGKGYATEMVGRYLENKGVKRFVLDIGGNLRIIGDKIDGSSWRTGIKNPFNPSTYATITELASTSCVTSGDYERYYTVNGKKYHHIIDSDTLMPAEYFSSITVITKNSSLADALSTALFCMSYEDGLKLVDSLEGVNALWIAKDGRQFKTDGFITIQ